MRNNGWGPAKCFVCGCGGRLLIGPWGLGKATDFLRLPMGLVVVQLSRLFGFHAWEPKIHGMRGSMS